MALKGNLKDFGVAQLLNLVHLARKTGSLTIRRNGTSATLYFREGRLLGAYQDGRDYSLLSLLQKSGKISAQQADAIRKRAEMKTDKEAGLLLLHGGQVTQRDILQVVRASTLDMVYSAFAFTDGVFQFDPNRMLPQEKIGVPIDLENVIMEGTRRLREWEHLQEELPDLDIALKFAERPGTSLRNINLSVEEWRVISFISPRNTVRQIARYIGLNEFQIRKIVYGLLSAGLVEVVRPEGAAPLRGAPGIPPAPPVKRSVVMRIIDKIRRIT
jgi:hypothetical protein